MGVHRGLFLCRSSDRIPRLSTPAANVTREGSFLHPAMNPSLFESFESRCLCMGKPGFDTAFGKNPTSLPGLDQQEFDLTAAHPVTDRSHLLAFPKFPQFRQADELG
jgi:hypothetical protein